MRRTVNDEVEQRMLYHYTVYERIKESKNLREWAREEGSKRKRDKKTNYLTVKEKEEC